MGGRLALLRLVPCAGLVVVVVGTFLPWLQSGRATRNSYATDGAVRRLLDVSGPVEAALRAWPFAGLLCALAVAAVIVGALKIGLALSMISSVVCGTVAVIALASSAHGLIRPATLGPAVTLTGSLITVFGVLACASCIVRGHDRVFGRDLP